MIAWLSRHIWGPALLLQVEELVSGYGRIQVLHGVSFEVAEGEVVALLGANGAGKTTMLRAVSGLLPTWSGRVLFNGKDLRGLPPEKRCALGLGHLPEGRGIFASLSVRENLDLGTLVRRDGSAAIRSDRDRMLDLFAILGEKIDQPAGSLSGGQQQMLAVARAMMARPKLLMIDELSFGLAPVLVTQLFNMVGELRKTGTTFLLNEQHAGSLDVADRAYVFRLGRNELSGTSAQLKTSGNLVRSYMGS